MNRLHNLDYLRGLAAFGIMIYHYLYWTFGLYAVETFIGRVGIYGVSIFYVLSGLTLHHVYFNKMLPSKSDVLLFIRKRIFRIFPLLWLVTLLYIILSREVPDLWKVFLNLSGLFGFIKWDAYFSTGVWSIGNELVFYAFFPFFILFAKSYKYLMIAMSTVIFMLYIYFAFIQLNASLPLSVQWKDYINPLNQVFLFLGGFLIGIFFRETKLKNATSAFILLTGMVLFVCYPVEGDAIHIVTGYNRLVFTLSCFLICIGFYKMSIKFPDIIHIPFSLLGEASYSVYLIHPIVYSIVGIASTICLVHLNITFSKHEIFALSIGGTLVASYFTYQYFEKYFIKRGSLKTSNQER